jgi:hypothetical protein
MEKITAAAIRIGNEIYTGPTHFAAMQAIISVPGMDPHTVADMLLRGEDGFITTEGRFVDRAEAFEIASQAAQMGTHELANPEKNMAFFDTSKPSLDSGLIESYAPLRVRRSNIY